MKRRFSPTLWCPGQLEFDLTFPNGPYVDLPPRRYRRQDPYYRQKLYREKRGVLILSTQARERMKQRRRQRRTVRERKLAWLFSVDDDR